MENFQQARADPNKFQLTAYFWTMFSMNDDYNDNDCDRIMFDENDATHTHVMLSYIRRKSIEHRFNWFSFSMFLFHEPSYHAYDDEAHTIWKA